MYLNFYNDDSMNCNRSRNLKELILYKNYVASICAIFNIAYMLYV
ncbi:putative membrane protein [Candidatus Neoehrlichia lotoris str. RAC413]|uniref:Putative membrane protein n=1 Tax=Candidatus Neoehrlichia procyonis str. RAC413 TaxID=1359163 RepID=A0A0F3NM89_9RICK|nr:putative membrane protein [Candidatus Neoehrlichia lotoris str. RAC413]